MLASADAGSVAPVSRSAALIPFLPLLGAILCGVCAIFRVKSKLPAFITVGCIGAAFALTVMMFLGTTGGSGHEANGDAETASHTSHAVVKAFDWINFKWGIVQSGGTARELIANFSFYIDSLTCLWMLFVTGLGTLIALYASEYMAGDVGQGYCRFFAAFGLFVFSMACLVMGDNLVLLYLGWEGVGLCSYLLIGYFSKKPSAVAAAKKAFVLNRIGDLGLSMGLMLTFVQFGTVEYAKLFPLLGQYLSGAVPTPFLVQLIPVLLTIGAFGKSAQLFLYVWLPDAMEGPTPVSALIHAATMVTAGVYLVARFMPVFVLSEWALPIVAWGGAITAFWAATIGMAQFDIKRIMAYSTVSQLGYMFAGLGVMGASGAASHVFTHAFFKALLFLACGAVMHGFAGQLDLRKLSGLRKMDGWKIVSYTMLVGCLNLAGVPFITSGFYSKDMILGDAFANHYAPIGWLLLITAGMTAYYTFRVFFRVFCGPVEFHEGDEAHGHDDHSHDAHGAHAAHGGHAAGEAALAEAGEKHDEHGHGHAHGFHPHAPGMAINLVLTVLAVASIAAVGLFYINTSDHGWVGSMVHGSTASAVVHHVGDHEHAHGTFFGMEAHGAMKIISGIVAVLGIGIAWYLHLAGRTTAATSPNADGLLRAIQRIPVIGRLPGAAQHKWYV
ncbi:MAG: NADH-quinone oxidoreductase subunit L, partial [Pyrinomonadaceae bacterium]|nr:NADH-quinone oxidoreductase subunit L [Phycisphaerales bacterium]